MTRAYQQNGFILLPVVLAIVLTAVIAFMLNNQSVLEVGTGAGEAEIKQAEYVTKAGMEHAIWGVQNSSCGGDMSMASVPFGQLGADSYSATATTGGSSTAYSLSADQDAWIRSDNPTNTGGGDQHVRSEGGILERSLYRFDLSSLPANAQVNSAVAWFYLESGQEYPEGPVIVNRVTADWTEAGATWDDLVDKLDKAVLGMIPAQPVGGEWVSVNLTTQVQAWINGQPNYGISLSSKAEGIYAEYKSRDDGSTSPRLDVVVGTGPASPAVIQSTGTLANGVTRTLSRPATVAYQAPGNLSLQLGSDAGEDAFTDSFYSARNYGGATYVQINDNGSDWQQYPLIRFDISKIPVGASVRSARLELHTRSLSAPGTATIHQVTRSWEEGTKSGTGQPDGASWFTYDGINLWASVGGDFNSDVVAESAINGGETWVSWEIGPLVERWLAGEPNHGLMIRPANGLQEAEFSSKEDSNVGVAPKLTIEYACECGSACLAPQGSGNVLMIVVNPTALVPDDQQAKDLFESWGYMVNVLSESANQSAYDSQFGSNDVVFISETVNSNQVGDKVKNAPIGVVTQDGDYNDDLGFSSGRAGPVGRQVSIVDNSHYITLPFVNGPLDIFSANMQGLTVSGAEAPDLQTLADWGSAGSLVVLDRGAQMESGGATAGRRVMLPLGTRYNFNWDYLNANGRLLVQRALAWGIGADATSIGNLLVVVVNPANLTTQEAAKKLLIESWSYTVNLIDESDSQGAFDTAIAANDVAYVSSTVSDVALGTKLINASIGVVNEQSGLVDEFGFGQQSVVYKSRLEINVLDNTHYITEYFPTGLLTILTGNQTLNLMTAGKGPGFNALAEVFNTGSFYDESLGVIETGGGLYGGGTAAGRRVLLPWGDASFDVAALNNDGQTILRRSIEWAGTVDPLTPLLMVVADQTALTTAEDFTKTLIESWDYTVNLIDDNDTQTNFDTAASIVDVAFVTSDVDDAALGTKLTDATIGVVIEEHKTWGDFELCSDRSGTGSTDMDITDNSHYISSPFSTGALTILTSAADIMKCTGTSAAGVDPLIIVTGNPGLLTLDTGAFGLDGQPSAGRRVTTPWGGTWDPSRMNNEGQTVLRRSIEWAAGANGGVTSPPGYLDEFNKRDCMAADYAGSDGSLDWTGSMWTESGESNGSCAGLVQVAVDPDVPDAGSYRLMLDEANRQVVRSVDLSSLASATLSFEYRRYNYPTTNDAFAVLVSRDGSTWAELEQFTGIANDPAYLTASYDISAFIEPTTHIAFATKGSNTVQTVYIDNVSITEGGGGGGGGGVVYEGFAEAKLASDGTSLSVSKPTGTAAGDLLVATMVTDGDQKPSMSISGTGWTQIDHGDTSKAVSMDVWWKIAGSSEPASYNFGWSKSQQAYGWIMRFTGHDATNPINVTSNSGGASSSPTSPAVTTTVPNAMILRIGGFDDDDINVDDTGLTGHTDITMDESSSSGGVNASGGAAFIQQPAAGNSGTENFILTASEEYRAVTIGIAPAP